MIGIYKIINPKGKVYIGQTIDYKRRKRHYKNLKCKEQPKLYNSFIKYGVENHIFSFIKHCSKDELTQWERHFQDVYNSVKSGLNCILVSTDDFSGGHSEESKKKISESLKGRQLSKEHKIKISIGNSKREITENHRKNLGNGNRGKKFSDEWKAKMSEAKLGTKRDDETKKKMSESAKNRSTKEWRENISKKLKGRVITDEWRRKLSEAAKNRNK